MTTLSNTTANTAANKSCAACKGCVSQASILAASDTPVRLLKPLGLAQDGFQVARFDPLCADEFQSVQQAEYASCKPGKNAKNKLARKTRWGAYIRNTFSWQDRSTYSLPKELNPEEGGAIREFKQLNDAFLHHPVTEKLLRTVFHAWGFEKSSEEQLYQVQLSAIRYEPTIEAPAWPSPVAPHQDLVDGAIAVLHRTENIVGGLSRIYDLDKRPLVQMDLRIGDILFVRDAEVLHQVTPLMLEPGENWSAGKPAYRDVLLIRFQPVGR